jgi:hypothetical protein
LGLKGLVVVVLGMIQAKALAEKNERDLQAQWEQEERHVSSILYYCASELLAAPLDFDI